MPALTPEERRGGLMIVLLLLLGAGWDFWRAAHVPPPRRFSGAAGGEVPIEVPGPAPIPVASAPAAPPDSVRRLDLNRAGIADLDRLPGIGPVLAARIVEHRRIHGPFRSVEELRAVRGVGPRLLERMRPLVTTTP